MLPAPLTDRIVLDSFANAMDTTALEIEKLILEAEVQHMHLLSLESDLAVIHQIAQNEDSSIITSEAEMLGQLWSKLGGNKRELRSFKTKLRTLRQLDTYRKKALVHIVTALHALRELSDDLEELRGRVQVPEITSSRIPVHVHLASICHGMERLQMGRIRAERRKEEAFKEFRTSEIRGT
jgi:hypothetical protein